MVACLWDKRCNLFFCTFFIVYAKDDLTFWNCWILLFSYYNYVVIIPRHWQCNQIIQRYTRLCKRSRFNNLYYNIVQFCYRRIIFTNLQRFYATYYLRNILKYLHRLKTFFFRLSVILVVFYLCKAPLSWYFAKNTR